MKRFLYAVFSLLCFASLTTAKGNFLATTDTVRQTPQDTVPVRRLSLQTLPVPLEPSVAMGERTYGVVTLSVASIRTQGRYPAEMATQALLGTPVRILERHDGWLRIQTPDNYTGYTKSGNVTEMNAATFTAWTDTPKIIFLAHHGFAYSRADRKSPPVSDLVAGNMLRLEGKTGAFYRISYPDGRTAFVLKGEAQPVDEWLKRINLTAESILATAQSFMGVPYLWGGTSSKAMDCSGLVKTVFFLHGLILQRDASQQCVTGEQIDITNGYGNLRPGDLLFFGKSRDRIRHVGIYMGNDEFIHEATQVKVGSLNPSASNYDALNASEFVRACRIIGAREWPGISTIKNNSYYQNTWNKQ
ncbi:C40 family peptidase [Tannerella sp.]|uniref:C40 family peptidase n=1 Tax=Tannerella sp. TaxID=2382127 RepID=UPI0026DC94A1|nr:C40 family peptidase [Tannerella sp.]MDO4702999.1 C40 family peptidase [Tannerella sp.]